MACNNRTRHALVIFIGRSSTPAHLPALLPGLSSPRIKTNRGNLFSSARAIPPHPWLSPGKKKKHEHCIDHQSLYSGHRKHSTSQNLVSNDSKNHSGSAVFASTLSSIYQDQEARSKARANPESDHSRPSQERKNGRHDRSYDKSYDRSFDRDQRAKKRTTSSKTVEPQKVREPWQVQKSALSNKFGSASWQPRKRLSPDALEGIRGLHAEDPDTFDTATLAARFEISPEAIRRILKSKWRPNDEEEDERRARWERRGQRIWSSMSELGIKPPKKWRQDSRPVPEELGTVSGDQSDPLPLSERIL
ncbi:MAG: Required for respiratory growth protein 9 mitochondrial [Ramalina farinacea]|uniref:Required for respiratory growth protein 9, mitochondrial n=1 Tax=Ramalina farinacea TaxID=258253 RepID=A0AA43TXX6_9LECA|nr:Required for respiratory growth protein 9 mitochondrial [Ramalina farinacea]